MIVVVCEAEDGRALLRSNKHGCRSKERYLPDPPIKCVRYKCTIRQNRLLTKGLLCRVQRPPDRYAALFSSGVVPTSVASLFPGLEPEGTAATTVVSTNKNSADTKNNMTEVMFNEN